MRAVDTTGWTWIDMRPHWPAVMQGLRRREAIDPDLESAERRIENITSGAERLWIVFDGDTPTYLVTMTVETVLETGLTKAVLLTMTATDHGAAMGLTTKIGALSVLPEIERWAAENGIDEIEMTGRVGLKRLMAPWGYRLDAVVLRKTVGG